MTARALRTLVISAPALVAAVVVGGCLQPPVSVLVPRGAPPVPSPLYRDGYHYVQNTYTPASFATHVDSLAISRVDLADSDGSELSGDSLVVLDSDDVLVLRTGEAMVPFSMRSLDQIRLYESLPTLETVGNIVTPAAVLGIAALIVAGINATEGDGFEAGGVVALTAAGLAMGSIGYLVVGNTRERERIYVVWQHGGK